MSSQRRVTAPPEIKAEVVTDSLRPDSLERQAAQRPIPVRLCAGIPAQRISLDSVPGSRAFAQAFSPSDLILPGIREWDSSSRSDLPRRPSAR